MGLDYQGGRALALLQGVARHVEAILGYLGRVLGDHPRSGLHGFASCALRIQDHQLYVHPADHDSGVLPLPIPDRAQPVV